MQNTAETVLENQLCFSLYRANQEIGRAYQPLFDRLGITYPQFLVLHTLWEKDKRTVGQIAERLSLESSNITPMVKRLEAAKFLIRTRNPADDRQVLVTLTELGHSIQESCMLKDSILLTASGMKLDKIIKLNDAVQSLLKCMHEVKQATGRRL